MIPTFEVDLSIEVDPRHLRLPTPGEVAYGVGDNRDYCWPGRMTWDDARTAIEEDTRLLEAADAESTTEDEFEDAIYEQGGCSSYGWLELGVRSTVVALLAAGCITTYSCRGHGAKAPGHPYIRFQADAARVLILLPLVKGAGCGMAPDPVTGCVGIWATSVPALHDLAARIIGNASQFDSLAPLVDLDAEGLTLGIPDDDDDGEGWDS